MIDIECNRVAGCIFRHRAAQLGESDGRGFIVVFNSDGVCRGGDTPSIRQPCSGEGEFKGSIVIDIRVGDSLDGERRSEFPRRQRPDAVGVASALDDVVPAWRSALLDVDDSCLVGGNRLVDGCGDGGSSAFLGDI